MAEPQRTYRFGPFRLNPAGQSLTVDGHAIPISPRLHHLLTVFARNPQKVLDKSSLLAAVWPALPVEEGNLTKGISQLRQILAAAGAPSYIETLPKRGYRFLPDVHIEAITTAPTQTLLAVLPFRNLSTINLDDSFCVGFAAELSARLSPVPGLRVLSCPNGPDAMAKLRPCLVVDGTIRKTGSRWRVTAQLNDAATGAHVWSTRYEHSTDTVFQTLDQIAAGISRALRLPVPPGSHRDTDLYVWESYWQGLYLQPRDAGTTSQALQWLHRAAELDPTFAPAYAAIAAIYGSLGSWESAELPPAEALPKARLYAEQALELDPDLPAPRITLGSIVLHFDWRFHEAEQHFQRVLDACPNLSAAHHGYSLCLAAGGRFEQAHSHSRLAAELDPLNPCLRAHPAWISHLARRPGVAVEQAARAVQDDPLFPWGHYFLGLGHEQSCQFDAAVHDFSHAVRHSKDHPVMLAALGRALALSGDRTAARRILAQLQVLAMGRALFAGEIALILSALGEREESLIFLEKAHREKSGSVTYWRVDPRFDDLRGSSRFEKLLPRPQ